MAQFLTSEQLGSVLVLRLGVDHIDAANSSQFRSESAPVIGAAQRVLLDLTGVSFIDSAGGWARCCRFCAISKNVVAISASVRCPGRSKSFLNSFA